MTAQTLSSTESREIISFDPSSGEELGRAPLLEAVDVQAAVSRARTAQPAWAALSYSQRGKYILQARELVLSQLEEILTPVRVKLAKTVPEAMS